jgi:hypothetical protein
VINVLLLFLTTGVALMVAVTLIVGIAWLAIAIPVVLISGAGAGLVALNRRWARAHVGRPHVGRTR